MKKYLFSLFFLFALTLAEAQVSSPVKWTATVKQLSNTEYELIAGYHK